MSRRIVTQKTSTFTTNRINNSELLDGVWLQDEDFDKRPKTDYTYARSATYSNKYEDGKVVSPNLSRRRLYGGAGDIVRDSNSSSSVRRETVTTTAPSTHVRQYGARRSQTAAASSSSVGTANLLNLNNNSRNQAHNDTLSEMRLRSGNSKAASSHNTEGNDVYRQERVEITTTTIQQQRNNNNQESIFSSDEDTNMSSRRAGSSSRRGRARSKSPGRTTRSSTSTRYRSKQQLINDTDSTDSMSMARGEIITRGGGGNGKASTYSISTGLDDDSELVTERSSTIIDTVSTGTPFTARLMGCILFVYGCTCIFFNRVWYSFGHPVYTTLQRCLLLDTWLLSRSFTRSLRKALTLLILLLVPLSMLMFATCGLHYFGIMNIAPCAPVTGVYYVTKQSDVNVPGLSTRIRDMIDDWYTWSAQQRAQTETSAAGGAGKIASVDWDEVINTRLNELKTKLELQSNAEVSKQRQKITELEASIGVMSQDIDRLQNRFSGLSDFVTELGELKRQAADLSTKLSQRADHSDAVHSLQQEIRRLQHKLGEVDLNTAERAADTGILVYLYNELSKVADVTKYILGLTSVQPVLQTTVNKQLSSPPPVPPPVPCPDSSCVCENDLALRLRKLYDDLLREMNSKEDSGARVYISSDNSTGLSEQLVKKMIKDELDIFAADHTGMPDFALQSMGAQVVSTRCSHTYSQESGLMTYFGLPLYHLYKDPSIVIQPGVVPGECWCFTGTAGSLVVELADNVLFNSFSLEHISAKEALTGEILSAPKDVEVYGLASELDSIGTRIGSARYDKNGPRLQFFPAMAPANQGFHIVELRVLSNWGQPEFTCLYRFRVHGKLQPKPRNRAEN